MKLRKIVMLLLCAVVAVAAFGCGNNSDGNGVVAKVYAPDGAPAIGLAAMIDVGYKGAQFNIVQPSDIGGHVLKGDADIAIMPTNAAALTYNKGAKYMVAGITNFGSLYVIADENVDNLSELVGKVVYSIGEGNVPDLVFRYLLRSAEIDYEKGTTATDGKVTLAYVSEGSAFNAGLGAGQMHFGVISEPAATVALGKVETAVRALDIQQLYAAAAKTDTGYPQAALVVKKEFYENNKEYVQDFINEYAKYANTGWAKYNPDKALTAIKKAGSTTVPKLTTPIVEGCNISYVQASSCKQQILDFLTALDAVKQEGETPIGGKLPDDNFFMA